MRANPRDDWRIADVERACREAGAQLLRPRKGSHYKVRNPATGRKLAVPARRPIKPVCIEQPVELLDEIENQ